MTDNIGIHPLNSSSTLITVAAFYLLIFIATLDAVIVGNALPAITEDLRSSESLYAWVGAAYNMAWAALLPTAAQVSEIFGRKPVVLGGAAVFSAGSIWAALSPTMTMLIAGRVVQGLGAGTCLASVSVSIADMFALR
jgi:MFS family permease